MNSAVDTPPPLMFPVGSFIYSCLPGSTQVVQLGIVIHRTGDDALWAPIDEQPLTGDERIFLPIIRSVDDAPSINKKTNDCVLYSQKALRLVIQPTRQRYKGFKVMYLAGYLVYTVDVSIHPQTSGVRSVTSGGNSLFPRSCDAVIRHYRSLVLTGGVPKAPVPRIPFPPLRLVRPWIRSDGVVSPRGRIAWQLWYYKTWFTFAGFTSREETDPHHPLFDKLFRFIQPQQVTMVPPATVLDGVRPTFTLIPSSPSAQPMHKPESQLKVSQLMSVERTDQQWKSIGPAVDWILPDDELARLRPLIADALFPEPPPRKQSISELSTGPPSPAPGSGDDNGESKEEKKEEKEGKTPAKKTDDNKSESSTSAPPPATSATKPSGSLSSLCGTLMFILCIHLCCCLQMMLMNQL